MGGETKPGGGWAAEGPRPTHPGGVGAGGCRFLFLDCCGEDAVPRAQGGAGGEKTAKSPGASPLPSLNDPGGPGREHLGSSMETQFGPLGGLAV